MSFHCQSPPTFSVFCYPCPYRSLLPYNVISPTTFRSSNWSYILYLPLCASNIHLLSFIQAMCPSHMKGTLLIYLLRHVCLFVGWLLNVPATCECISGTDLLRQFYVLPHRDRSCRSNFPSHPVTVYWHQADQSQRWPYNARRLAG